MRITALCALLFLTSLGCEKKTSTAATDVASYTVRGKVKSMSPTEVFVHHEEIPSFKDQEGRATGMVSMSMAFGIDAKKTPAKDLKVGDPVELSFDVRWNEKPRLLITKLKSLPPETKLDLSGH